MFFLAAVMVVVMPMRIIFQHKCARYINSQAQAGYSYRRVELNRQGMNDPVDGFTGHDQTDATQDNCAGKRVEHSKFPRSKTETEIGRVLSGEKVGEDRYQKRSGMGSHVQAVREKSHRVKFQTEDDFGEH